MEKATILKVDVEGYEKQVFLQNLCLDPKGLPFDQLLIELHGFGPPGFYPDKGFQYLQPQMVAIFECLEANGFVIFSREPNVQPCACNHRPLWTYEYSFVKRGSVFTTPLVPMDPAPTSTWERVMAWQEQEYLEAVTKRQALVKEYATWANRGISVDGSDGWEKLPCWHCKGHGVPVFYIWDLFEPRYPCPSRRFGEADEVRCLHADEPAWASSGAGGKPKFKRVDLLTESAWSQLTGACATGSPRLLGVDELVLNARLFNSSDIGSGAQLASLVGCLEEAGFRLYSTEVDSIRCEVGQNAARYPDTALLGFVQRDSAFLRRLVGG